MDLLIAGTRRPAADGGTLTVDEPATGATMATVSRGTAADVDAAITAARDSFDRGVWADQSATARG